MTSEELQQLKDWFDAHVGCGEDNCDGCDFEFSDLQWEVENIIKADRERLREQLEGMKVAVFDEYDNGYNMAIVDVLSILEEEV